MPTTGEKIKQLRRDRHLTQYQLAEKAGVSSQVISNMERSYTSDRPKLEVMVALAKVLGTTVDYLLGTSEYSVGAISQQEQELVEGFRRISPQRQDLVLHLLRELVSNSGKEA